jgi:hypothetical protein
LPHSVSVTEEMLYSEKKKLNKMMQSQGIKEMKWCSCNNIFPRIQ